MALKQVFLLAASFIARVQADLVVRQDAPNQQYIDSVCSPSVNGTTGATIPPCISIKTIQEQCKPNGTKPLDFAAHAQCLCNAPSTFFSDWLGCRNCILIHGGMTQRGHDTYANILGAASSALCSGTPTAAFEDVFATMEAQATPVTTGSTVTSDQFPKSAAVSLYYTASGVQGPGAITGSATGATASIVPTSTSAKQDSTTSGNSKSASPATISGTAAGAASTSKSSTSTAKSGALPTGKVGLEKMMIAAGGALLAVW